MNGIITGISVGYNKLKEALLSVNGSFNADLRAQRQGFYGLFSKPLIRTATTVLKLGRRNIVLSEENPQLKIELADGEVALFDGVNTVKLSREKGIEIQAVGKISIGGAGAMKVLTESFIEFFNTHTHTAAGGATTPPTVPVVAAAVSTKITEVL